MRTKTDKSKTEITIPRLLINVATVGVVAVVAAIAVASGGTALAGPRNTPRSEILVVTANLEEAYAMDNKDLASHFEIDNFATRVREIIPEIPDVVLLQEVNRETSQLAAARLSARLGQKFVVAVRPIANTTIEYPDKQVHTETAILLNAKTMATENRGGYFAASYPTSATPAGERVQVRRHAFMLARERGTGVKVPLVSLHYAMERSFKTQRLSSYWRAKWSGQIKNLLARRYNADSDRRAAVIGGDFNAAPCLARDFTFCDESAWWKTMTSAPHRYAESGRAHLIPHGVDALFTRGDPVRAGWDQDGKFAESNRSRFYSDHRFRWAVVAPKAN